MDSLPRREDNLDRFMNMMFEIRYDYGGDEYIRIAQASPGSKLRFRSVGIEEALQARRDREA